MKCKTAYLIINPRLGKNVAKLTDMLAVFSAAGWKTDVALKEFGGHTMRLAKAAAEAGYDLVIGYGGDGTLNQVVNGVMSAKRRRSIVGIIPGGTANVWAHEIGIPEDPVKASLLLVNSDGRKVDLGHVEVESLSLPPGNQDRQRKQRPPPGGRHCFLLMAGLGVDAAILRRVSTPLKERIGEAAVALAAAKEMPSQHAFPIEIRSSGAGKEQGLLWKGEALQVIVGNTRRYGNIAEATPEARIDDGALDVCVITAGDPLTTIEQVLSTLLHRQPVHGRSEYFRGAHFWISAPATVDLQLDGSRVKLKDFLGGPDRTAIEQSGDADTVMVTYRFDAMPRALRMAIPRTYDGALFEEGAEKTQALATEQQHPGADAEVEATASGKARRQGPEELDALLEHGRKVTVVGVGPDPEREGTYIVAGGTSDRKTGESKPVAVRIDHDTTLARSTGEPLSLASAAELPEGGVIVVEGKRSKRGVIRAKRVAVVT
jgi:YegS/Rv2252/BmrU family lipid kinase